NPMRGAFALEYWPPGPDPNRLILLVPWTPSPAIRRGTATNRLAIIAQGDWLRLFMNGEQVGEARDPHRPWGKIAWGMLSDARDRTVEVEFSNLLVSTPGPPYALAALLPWDSPATAGAPAAGPSAPPALGRVLYQDDFSDPASGWPRQSSDPALRVIGYEA